MSVSLAILSAAHSHAHAYATALESVPGAELVAIADDDETRGESFAAEHDVDYGPTEDVLAQVDGAVVCSENTRHIEWVHAAADAGVDVLSEKPLATTRDDAQAMVDRCEDAGVNLGVAMPVRFNEPIRRAKAAYDDGELGALRALIGTNLLTRMSGSGWISNPDLGGGGAIMDHTVHVVDLGRWISGKEVTEVFAYGGTRFADLEVEDISLASMQLGDEIPFSHEGSWRQPDTWDFWGDVTMRLIGDEQVIEVDCFDRTFKHTHAEDGVQRVEWGEDMNAGMLADFAAAVEADRTPEVSGEEGVAEVRVVEAAYESVERGEPVTVQYD